MDRTLLVTGGTGLAGSNTALLATQRGWRVKALVRDSSAAAPLTDAGVEVVTGDLTDDASLRRAMQGVTDVVHTAAALGGSWSTHAPETMWSVNHRGALAVLDAAAAAGVERVVAIDTQAILDPAFTQTERSPLIEISDNDSAYVASKRAFHHGLQERAAAGQHACVVTPGCLYGSGPFPERVMDPTSFTSVLQRGIVGEITEYVKFPLFWTYAPDLADVCLKAVEHGRPGRRYLCLGGDEDVSSLAEFCNEGAELAGSPHRVTDLDPHDLDGPDIGTMRQFALRTFATPYLDDSATRSELGTSRTPRAEALRATVDWLAAQQLI